MFTDRNDTWNTRRTVVAYAAAGVLVVSLINLLLAALGLDDGSPADFIRGASFIALTSLLLWLLLDRKRRRLEALRESAAIQQALAGQSNDVLILEDDTGLIVTVNRRAEETYALTGAALLGLRTRDLRFPEARAAADAARARLQVDGVAYFTTEHVTADGRRFPAEESSRVVEIEGRRYVHDPRRRQCSLASVTSLTYVGDRFAGLSYAEPAGATDPDAVPGA